MTKKQQLRTVIAAAMGWGSNGNVKLSLPAPWQSCTDRKTSAVVDKADDEELHEFRFTDRDVEEILGAELMAQILTALDAVDMRCESGPQVYSHADP